MRRLGFLAALLFIGAARAAEPEIPDSPTANISTSLATPGTGAYSPPAAGSLADQTAADSTEIGKVERRFVRASQLDTPEQAANPVVISTLPPEKVALDKRIFMTLHDVENNPFAPAVGDDALRYELTYLNWGANSSSQLKARQGHYFTVTVVNRGPRADLNVLFQYRQSVSREVVRSLSSVLPQAHGATRAYFAVVNKAFATYGAISSWRISVFRGDTVVAQLRSFIW